MSGRWWVLGLVLLVGWDASLAPSVTASTTVRMGLQEAPWGRCCEILTVNAGAEPVRVLCELYVFDRRGRLAVATLVPGAPRGERRNPASGMSGLTAPVGRRPYGWMAIPVDLDAST